MNYKLLFLFNLQFVNTSHCSTHQFRCRDNSACIPLNWLCDHLIDCSDASDETHCTTTKTTITTEKLPLCPKGIIEPFYCIDKSKCISESYTCNGRNDCFDGSDESKSLCKSVFTRPNIFKTVTKTLTSTTNTLTNTSITPFSTLTSQTLTSTLTSTTNTSTQLQLINN